MNVAVNNKIPASTKLVSKVHEVLLSALCVCICDLALQI